MFRFKALNSISRSIGATSTWYQSSVIGSTSSSQTHSSVSLGLSQSGNKTIVVPVGYCTGSTSTITISSATIAGTSAKIIQSFSTTGFERSAIIYAEIPGTTTSGDIVLNFSSAFTNAGSATEGSFIGIYVIDSAPYEVVSSAISSVRNGTLGTHSRTFNTGDGAFVFGSMATGGASSGAHTWTNATEDAETTSITQNFSHASMISDGATETISVSPDTEYGYMTLAAFKRGVVFNYTGSTQTFNVPAGVTSIDVRMWGAAGGSSDISSATTSGAGGYAEATVDVTGQSTVTVYVGGGGSGAGAGAASTPGGWGYGSGGAGEGGGAGGGGSAITFSTTPVLVAGGGGGRSADDWDGGAGGGTNGQDGDGGSTDGIGGFGATGATGGGADAEDTGDALDGGNAPGGDGGQAGGGGGAAGGGGGGGGYAGGGGGGGGSSTTEGGGGGGSGFANTTYCTSVTLTTGSGPTPADFTDTFRPDGVGQGTSTTLADGGDGYVIITY